MSKLYKIQINETPNGSRITATHNLDIRAESLGDAMKKGFQKIDKANDKNTT